MSQQMDATKDSTGELTSPNPIQYVAEFVKETLDHKKIHMDLGLDYPNFVDHIF